jgi:glycosyltransferase involved in cell wall biosynthesis
MHTAGLNVLMIGPYPHSSGKIVGGVQSVVASLAPALADDELVAKLAVLSFHRGETRSRVEQIDEKLDVYHVRGQRRMSVLTRSILSVLRARIVIARLRPDVVHGHGLGWSGDIAAQVSPSAVITVHGLIQKEARMAAAAGGLRASMRVALVDRTVEAVLRRAAVVVSLSTYDAGELAGRVAGHHVIVPNPVGRPFVERYRPTASEPRLVFAGVMGPRKNVLGLLNAFALLHRNRPEARLSILGPTGDAAYAARVREHVVKLGLAEVVDFVGFVENDQLIAELQRARALVLFSQEETLPTIIAQAMALGKPVVASSVGGIPSMVAEGESGYLVAPGDERGLAERMDELIGKPELAAALVGSRGGAALRRGLPARTRRAQDAANRRLAHAADDELEVAALGKPGGYGVVARLAGLVDDLDAAAGLGCGGGDGLLEGLGADLAGAGGAGEQTAGRDHAQGEGVEARVGALGGEAALLAFGEAGRVEDDEVEAAAFAAIGLEQLEAVAGDEAVPVCVEAAERDVGGRGGSEATPDVDALDRVGAAAQGVEREAPGVREAVEHAAARAERLDEAPVLALVEEEAGFLADVQVGLEAQPVLDHG